MSAEHYGPREASSSPPRCGVSTSMLRRARSGSGRAGRRRRSADARSTSRISISANGAPAQRRTPPPNGIHESGFGAGASSHRSGRNSIRLGPQILAPAREPQAGCDLDAAGHGHAVDLGRLEQQARRDRQRGSRPQDLLDDRVEVRGVAVAQPRVHRRVAGEQLERPRERRRRAVVPAHEQRHQLIAQVPVARRVAVLVALLEQHREHRVSRVAPRAGARAARTARRRSARPRDGTGPTGSAARGPCARPPSRAPRAASAPCRACPRSRRGAWASSSSRAPNTTRRMISSVSSRIRSSAVTGPFQVASSRSGEL